jgi:tRNA A37 threonylcarbamoyladenosine dehydratase
VTDITLASHDRLLQRVRKVLRADHGFPRGNLPFDVTAVYLPETPIFPEGVACDRQSRNCNTGYGTAVFVTGAFGFAAAASVVHKLIHQPAK